MSGGWVESVPAWATEFEGGGDREFPFTEPPDAPGDPVERGGLTQPWTAEQVARLKAVRDAAQQDQTEQDGADRGSS